MVSTTERGYERIVVRVLVMVWSGNINVCRVLLLLLIILIDPMRKREGKGERLIWKCGERERGL